MAHEIDAYITSHTVHACDLSQLPLTIHEVQMGEERRWFIDDHVRSLEIEMKSAPWDTDNFTWQGISQQDRRRALLTTLVASTDSEDSAPFKTRLAKTQWQNTIQSAEQELKQTCGWVHEAPVFASSVHDDPMHLATLIREYHQAPRSALRALEEAGTLRGRNTYSYMPEDLSSMRADWSVRAEHDVTPLLRSDLPYLAVREGYANAPISKSAGSEITLVNGLWSGAALAGTGRGRMGGNASLFLGSQEIAATFMARDPEEEPDSPRAFLSFYRQHGLYDDFRKADAQRILDQCATETRDSRPHSLGSFGLAAETAYDLLDPRSPEGREMGGFISAMRRSCSEQGRSATSVVPAAWGQRMADFARSYPDKTMALSMAQIAMIVAHQARQTEEIQVSNKRAGSLR